MKSREEILKEVIVQDCKDRLASTMGNGKAWYVREDLAHSAMQTYAEQESEREACEFYEWVRNNTIADGAPKLLFNQRIRNYFGNRYTTSQLFKIYQNENTKS